jgi:hypothetical protein
MHPALKWGILVSLKYAKETNNDERFCEETR